MEWVDGVSLLALFKPDPRPHSKMPSPPRIIADACAGLHAAHELRDETGLPLNVVHRDVSPHNVLVSINGQVKVADFVWPRRWGWSTRQPWQVNSRARLRTCPLSRPSRYQRRSALRHLLTGSRALRSGDGTPGVGGRERCCTTAEPACGQHHPTTASTSGHPGGPREHPSLLACGRSRSSLPDRRTDAHGARAVPGFPSLDGLCQQHCQLGPSTLRTRNRREAGAHSACHREHGRRIQHALPSVAWRLHDAATAHQRNAAFHGNRHHLRCWWHHCRGPAGHRGTQLTAPRASSCCISACSHHSTFCRTASAATSCEGGHHRRQAHPQHRHRGGQRRGHRHRPA